MLAALWEWRSVIGWALVALVALAVFGFMRPVFDALLGTYSRIILPLAERLFATKYGLAVVAGVAFIAWSGFMVWIGDRRAEERCGATIAIRERDTALAELRNTRERLAELEAIRLQDATRALADAETQSRNEERIRNVPKDARPCFDESVARRVFGGP